jgi:hypothetical protein
MVQAEANLLRELTYTNAFTIIIHKVGLSLTLAPTSSPGTGGF